MVRKLLGALVAMGVSCAASAGMAFPIFDGTVTYQTATNACSPAGNSFNAIYRPQIGTTAPKTGLVISQYRSGFGVQLTGNGQLSGAGTAGAFTITQTAALVQNVASFSFTQSPAAVVATTQQITLSGKIVLNGSCQHVFKAVFLRRPGT